MSTNVVNAVFGGQRTAKTRELRQWDYGQILRFVNLPLPPTYIVHFANQLNVGTAKTQIGDEDGVVIPDEYLTTGLPVYAFVFLNTGNSDGETAFTVTIPVIKRPQPTEDAPTPVQQGLIEQAIADLNAGVEAAWEAVHVAQAQAIDVDVENKTLIITKGTL